MHNPSPWKPQSRSMQTEGMDAKSIAQKVKDELNNLLRAHGRQRNSVNYDF